jgi:hypothetical protein
LLATAAAAAAHPTAWGQTAQAEQTAETVLTVSGRLKGPPGTPVVYSMRMLEAMPQISVPAKTPWFNESHTFTGPLLRDVLARCGAQGDTLRLKALNDFRADMPMADALQHDVVLARLKDGKPMTVREKGPLFVMYPFNAKPELRSTVYYTRSVWQLRWIEVL